MKKSLFNLIRNAKIQKLSHTNKKNTDFHKPVFKDKYNNEVKTLF